MDERTAIAADEATSDPCPHCGQPIGDAWLVCAWCGEPVAAPAELPVGARLHDGRYQVLRVIGRGGFGITYEVGDRRLERRVAVKELFPDTAVRHGSKVLTPPNARAGFRSARERFLREARVLARFSHPGIVRVFEVFEEHGTAYLVMELLDGRTLIDLLRQRGAPFTEPEILDVAARVAAALRPVHVAGVLHRDINPSNVMLTSHGRVVVIDFGLARDFDLDQTVGMTRVVTPGYAPLEQYRGEGRFGPSTDVYGLSATCYRLATGRVPVAALERDGGTALVAPSVINPAISKPVSDALLDGLELEPSHRPQDLDAFLARLGTRLPDGPRSLLVEGGFDLHPTAPAPDPAVARPRAPGGAPAVAAPAAPLVAPPPSPIAGPDETSATRVDGFVGSGPRQGAPVAGAPTVVGLDQTRAAGSPATRAAAAPDRVGPAAGPARPLTVDALVPGSDLRVPLAVGRDQPGRRAFLIPTMAVLLAVGSAAPVLATMVLVLVGMPALATIGDGLAHRLRAEHGVASGWAEQHLPAGVLAPARFVRNVGVSVVRSSPIIGIGAVLLGAWYGLEHTSLPQGFTNVVLRLIGALSVGLVAVTSREGSSRFRTGLGLEHVIERAVPGGRTTERVIIGWIVAVLVVALSLWLAPDPFPLP